MNERFLGKAAIIAAFLFIAGFAALDAQASISVSPVLVNLDNEHTKDVVRVSNLEEITKSYQVEIVAWSQTDERREVYSPTEELIAVPPLFSLEPGEDQLVRVGMIVNADQNIERSYRMFITELAPQTADDQPVGISMRLQIGVPVFVAPSQGLPNATLDYVESLHIGGQLYLRFKNNGNSHVKVTEVHYSAPGSSDMVVTPAVFYVLPGQTGYLPVAFPEGELTGTVTVVTDGLGSLEYELPVSP